MRITVFIGPDLSAHPFVTQLDGEALNEHFAGRVYWCADATGSRDENGVVRSFDLAALAGRVLARSPEACGRVVVIGAHSSHARDWLRTIFPSTPICAVGASLDWPGTARVVSAIEGALHLEGAEEPW